MKAVKILSSNKEYIWGGNKLKQYSIKSNDSNIAEAWIFSFNPNGLSTDANGNALPNVLLAEDLGEKYSQFETFPYLIKLIDADKMLSIQVHPNDEYAKKNEHSLGKCELWYILEAKEGAFIYLGLNDNYTPNQVKEAIRNNTICNLLNKVYVKKGDCYFVDSGTIHSIGEGIVLLEVQQNSTLTYRVYDFARKDKNGKLRELHIDKALDVINFKKLEVVNIKSEELMKTNYFVANKISNIKSLSAKKDAGFVISFIEGNGIIDNQPFAKGNTFFIKANQTVDISGDYTAITTSI